MEKLFALILLTTSIPAAADVATFSTENLLLELPVLSINGSAYYENVEIFLNPATGQFTIMAASKVSAADIGARTVNVALGKPGTLFTGDSLTVLDIQDSRCPTGAQCIVAGEVTVGLQLQDVDDGGITLMDLTLEGLGNTLETVDTQDYSFRLLKAAPYPVVDETIADAGYTFTVEYSLRNP